MLAWEATQWRPATTFVLTAVDLVNAMEVVPGTFGRRGHDYREDLPEFVRDAYGLAATDEQMAAIEQRLRERELAWAGRRVVAEQVARAREAMSRELRAWGVSPELLDSSAAIQGLAADAQDLLSSVAPERRTSLSRFLGSGAE